MAGNFFSGRLEPWPFQGVNIDTRQPWAPARRRPRRDREKPQWQRI